MKLFVLDGVSRADLLQLYGAVAKQQFVAAVAAGVDVNKDGKSDLVIGVPGASAVNPAKPKKQLKQAGAVYGLDVESKTVLTQRFGSSAKAGLGSMVKGTGDLNGDGYNDWLLTAPKLKSSGCQ